MTSRTTDQQGVMDDGPGEGPEAWVDRHGDCLYRYALLRLRSPDLASDAVQETFLDALRAQGSFAGRSSERTWLVGILRHKILDHFRRARRTSAVEAVRAGAGGAAGGEFDGRGQWALAPAAWRGEPGRDLDSREFWDVFGRCLSKIPPGLADAFFLREVDGLEADEIQEVLGITPANFWARMHRARSQLRRCLESNWFGDRAQAVPPPDSKGPARP